MKTLLLIMLLIQIPLLTICQEKHYGLTVGSSFSKWLGDDDLFAHSLAIEMNQTTGFSDFTFNSDSRVGFSVGFFLDVPVKKSFSIQPEISYIQKGVKFTGTGSYDGSYSVKSDMVYQLDYIDLVLLAKYSFPITESNIKPYLIAGPGIGYLASSRLKVKVSVDGESDSQSTKADGVFQTIDAHLNFGGGIDFSESLRLDFRYSLSLTSVTNDQNSPGLKLRNNVISINLAAYF